MTNARIYPLTPAAWGAGVEIPVDNVVQALLFSDYADKFGTSYVDVLLEPDPLTKGWRVRCAGSIIGDIGPDQRAQFSDIERVHAAGLTPGTTAGVRLNRERGLFDVDVFLPPDVLAVPRNAIPYEHVLLPGGDMFVVDTSRGDFTSMELYQRSPGQWLVGLTQFGDDIVVTLDGRVLGVVEPDDAAEISQIMTSLSPAAVCARVHILNGMAGLDVSAPIRQPELLPPLAPAERDVGVKTWHITDFPDGSWAVLVERDYAVDPEDRAEPSPLPRHASVDFTPTTTFRAAPASYIAKGQQPRADRSTAYAGRHRR